jgi:LL-H family phage holin
MDNIIFYALQLVIVVAISLFTKYALPFLKAKVDMSKIEQIAYWVGKSVLAEEQTVIGEKEGPKRKAKVTEFLKKLLIKKNISISDEQLNTLIEAAVKAMNDGKEEKE